MNLILSLFLLVSGLVMIFKPRLVYDLTESWKSDSPGEPSDLFILDVRIGGSLCSLVGFVGSIYFLFCS